MPEVVIKYKTPKTLRALKDFAKYFDFTISPALKDETLKLNGVTIISGQKSSKLFKVNQIFSGKNINAKDLRKKAWERKG